MANNNNNRQSVFENYATVFGENKAYTFGMTNGKYRLAVASCIPNNGNPQWDFRNTNGVSLDAEDLNRFLTACKSIAHIYCEIRRDPKIAEKYPIYTTRLITVPLVAKSTGKPYGDITIGFKPMGSGNGDTFYFQFQTTSMQDGSITKDYFYFKRNEGSEGKILFRNENGIEMKSSDHNQLMFANFIRMVEAALNFGRIGYGIHTAMKFSGGGNNNNFRGNGNGGNWSDSNGGGNSGAYGNSQESGFPDDMPF